MYTHLISAEQLLRLRGNGQPLVVFDCSFDLGQPEAGYQHYLQAQIPGADYAHLDTALSAKSATTDTPASGGRHPLPSRERFADWLGAQGLGTDTQAVVYDRNGANFCGRLWWMLRWCGHDAVAVLDGGLQAWQALGADGAVASGEELPHAPARFALRPSLVQLATTTDVLEQLGTQQTVLDARAGPRFRGEIEPLDPVAGHIPGARNRPFSTNLGADGRFKPPAVLRAEFEALLDGRDAATVVHHCGSGVSAVPNLLAMEIAGLGSTRLYAGSWSEWCSSPARPVERG